MPVKFTKLYFPVVLFIVVNLLVQNLQSGDHSSESN